MKPLLIGFRNAVNANQVTAIVRPGSQPIKRLVQAAKEVGKIIDATEGRRTRSVIVMENGAIALSALMPTTLLGRLKGNLALDDDEPQD